MDLDYKELFYQTIDELAKEDAILLLFKYIKEKIPFDTAICCSADRENNVITTFVEYSTNKNIPHYSYKKNVLFSRSDQEKHYGKNLSNVFFHGNIHEEQYLIDYYEDTPHSVTSVLSIPVYVNEEKNHIIYVTFYSQRENMFSNEDVMLASFMQSLFKRIVLPLYFNNPNIFLRFYKTSPMPSTYENQLRHCQDLYEVMQAIDDIAKHNTTVLITGETGTGKEIVAETIHSLSSRAEKAFIRVNCGAIPESLIESELFGFEKGAFTGAIQAQKGYFEQANNGTIYLDEIGELSKNAQIRLLRVLENREIRRIGSERTIKLNIRIIAATNKNLEKMILDNSFREDLFYRLNVFPINIPPLSERKNDIFFLINYYYNYYIQELNLQQAPKLSKANIEQLIDYAWPGNVRQLRHSIERSLLSSKSRLKNELDFSFLSNATSQNNSHAQKKKLSVEEIKTALTKSHGRIQGKKGAAELLNIHPATLRSRMRVLGIPFSKKDIQNVEYENFNTERNSSL